GGAGLRYQYLATDCRPGRHTCRQGTKAERADQQSTRHPDNQRQIHVFRDDSHAKHAGRSRAVRARRNDEVESLARPHEKQGTVTMDAIEHLLRFGLATRFDDLPAEVVERSRLAILDTL